MLQNAISRSGERRSQNAITRLKKVRFPLCPLAAFFLYQRGGSLMMENFGAHFSNVLTLNKESWSQATRDRRIFIARKRVASGKSGKTSDEQAARSERCEQRVRLCASLAVCLGKRKGGGVLVWWWELSGGKRSVQFALSFNFLIGFVCFWIINWFKELSGIFLVIIGVRLF